MLVVTAGEIYAAEQAFQELENKELPVQTAHRIARLLRELRKESKTLEETRQRLIKEYGVETEGQWEITDPAKQVLFSEEMKRLADSVIQFPENTPLLDIADLADIRISARAMAMLTPFLKD